MKYEVWTYQWDDVCTPIRLGSADHLRFVIPILEAATKWSKHEVWVLNTETNTKEIW